MLIVQKVSFIGEISVTVEGVGTTKLRSFGEPLAMLAANVETAHGGSIVACNSDRGQPYELVSFDRQKAELVVRRRV